MQLKYNDSSYMGTALKILHLEDTPEDAILVERQLKAGNFEFALRWVTDEKDFQKALTDFRPDVILSDHSLPGFDSIKALKLVHNLGLNIPFILVTATISEEFAVSILKQGAEDYILKDRMQRLPDAVQGAVQKYRDQKIHQQQQEQIINSERKFRGMIENTSELIGVFDRNFKMIYRSPNYTRILGWSNDELMTMGGLVTAHPDDQQYVHGIMDEVLKNPRKTVPVSYRLQHKDGSYRWVEGIVVNMLDDEAIGGLVSNLRDVTQNKHEALLLHEAHERLLFHLENAPLGFVEWDNTMKMRSWSARAQEIFGWQIGEFREQGRNVYHEIYEADREWVTGKLKELLSGRVERNHFQCRNTTKTGGVIWCEWFNSVQRDQEGKVVTIMSLVQNITEQKIADEMVQKSEANLTAIIENTDAFIYSIDRHFKYITFNTRLKEVILLTFGIELQAGMHVHTFIASAQEQQEWERIYQQVFEGKPQQFVKEYSQGSQRAYVSFSLNPIFEQGFVTGISCFSRDVTPQYVAEEEKNNLVQQLIRHNNDLLQFSFIASHNLRGPVASLLGLIQLLDPRHLTGEATALVPHLQQASLNLDNVVRDIAEIVNIRAGEVQAKEWVNILDVIEKSRHLLEGYTEVARVRFKITEIEVTEFYTIRLYFKSILYNLISNAIKFQSHDRPPEIEIRTFRKDSFVYITVRDNGIGIDLERFGDKVFGMYHRFNLGVEGKGLGLYMVKTQVETLNGTIEIESEIDKGTLFTIGFKDEQILRA